MRAVAKYVALGGLVVMAFLGVCVVINATLGA